MGVMGTHFKSPETSKAVFEWSSETLTEFNLTGDIVKPFLEWYAKQSDVIAVRHLETHRSEFEGVFSEESAAKVFEWIEVWSGERPGALCPTCRGIGDVCDETGEWNRCSACEGRGVMT